MAHNLYIVMGVAGSGKSTWIQNHIMKGEICVSRDKIRFAMLSPEVKDTNDSKAYFAHEKEVKQKFIEEINRGLKLGNVYVDATHLTRGSRNMVLSHIQAPRPDTIACIYIKVPLETALKQNAKREGLFHVPDNVIENMYNSIEEPSFNECFDRIYTVEGDTITCRARED